MNKSTFFFALPVLSLLFAASLTLAADETVALKEDIAALKQGQEQMQKDLEEIKKLLQQGARAAPGQQPFAPKDMELGNVPYKGQASAPVTMVEFSDYQCPFCKRHAQAVMPQLIQKYVDTGQLRFVMREFPITNLHARAVHASTAALCAFDQGQYWGMHDALFEDQKANTDEGFQLMAANLGLDEGKFTLCMASGKYEEQINADILEGQGLGISGTPSFVFGLTDPDDPRKVHLTEFVRGAQPLPTFEAIIERLLKESKGED